MQLSINEKNNNKSMPRKILDIQNKKFNSLRVLSFSGQDKKGNAIWMCKCDCGEIIETKTVYLRNGDVKSCGCRRKNSTIKRSTKHGMHGTRFYFIYHGIKKRCNNKQANNYHNYGGRGIKCEWLSFNEFKKDMYRSYVAHSKKHGEKNTTIDRINNNGNYNKLNCRWATQSVQNRNTRRNAK